MDSIVKNSSTDLARKVLAGAMSFSNQNVRTQVQEMVEQVIDDRLVSSKRELKDIEISTKSLLNNELQRTQPRLALLERKKHEPLQDQTVVIVREDLLTSPISNGTFTAVTYNINGMMIERKNSLSQILALSIVLGGMIGIILVLTQNAIIRKK